MRCYFLLFFLTICCGLTAQVSVIGANDITICPDDDLNDFGIIQLREAVQNGFGNNENDRSFTISLNENDFSFNHLDVVDINAYTIQDSSFRYITFAFDNAQTLRVSYALEEGVDGNTNEISSIFISGLRVKTNNVEDHGAEIQIQGADIGFGSATKIADIVVLNYTPTLASSVSSFCAGNGNGVNLSIEQPTGSGFEYIIERKLSTEFDISYTAITPNDNAQPSYWDVITQGGTYIYRAKIEGPSYCQVESAYSNEVTVTVNAPDEATFDPAPTGLSTQTPAFNLNTAFDPTITTSGSWSGPGVLQDRRTFSPAIFTNQGNQSNIVLEYTYRSNGCWNTIDAPAFDVSDIPEYVSPVNNTQTLPLCEVNQNIPFKITANKNITEVDLSVNRYSSAITNVTNLNTKDVRMRVNPYYEYGGVINVRFKLEGESNFRQESISVQRSYIGVDGINSYSTYCETDTIELEVDDGIEGNFRYSFYPYSREGGFDQTYIYIDSLDRNNSNTDTLLLAGLKDGRYRMEFVPSTTTSGCDLSTVNRYFYVQQTPDSDVEIRGLLQGGLLCDEDTIVFLDTIPSSRIWNNYSNYHTIDSLYKRYRWEFGDGSSTALTPHDTLQKHKFLSPGRYTAKLFVEETFYYEYPYRDTFRQYSRVLPCATTYNYDITIGATPKADFVIEDYYINPSGSKFHDSTQVNTSETNPDDIQIEWRWYFGDGSTSSIEHPSHIYLVEGLYDVSLATEAREGCIDSITRTIPVFPEYVIDENNSKVFTFLNQFNSEGWYSTSEFDGGQNSSWRITIPNGDTIVETGTNRAWMTSNRTNPDRYKHSVDENSWVLSPVFDVSAMEKPMVSMLYWVASENRVDGATMQYSVSDTTFGNENWITLGEYTEETGNWFNTQLLTSNPGNTNDQFKRGWTGITEGWTLARTGIDDAVDSAKAHNNGKIQFRVAFASNDDPPEEFDGFAFDDFFIGERTRQVLIENFTTTVSNIISTRDAGISEAVGRSNDEAILINYHIQADYPNSNYFFQYNPSDLGSRGLYYGVGYNNVNNNLTQLEKSAPRSFVDGIFTEDKPFIQDEWGEQAYSLRILDPTSFEITTPTVVNNGNSLSISTDILRTVEVDGEGPFYAYVVVLKDSALNRLDEDNEDKYYDNVVVQILPSAAGAWFSSDWEAGITQPLTVEWELYETTEPNESYQVLAFIQDAVTKEVYQTSSLVDIASLDVPNPQNPIYGADQLAKFSAPLEIKVYESGSDKTPIHLSFAPGEGKGWQLYDMTGTIVSSGELSENQHIVHIDNNMLASGIYLFKVEGHEAVAKIRVVK